MSNEDEPTDRRRVGAIERHAQSVLAVLVAGMVTWMATQVYDSSQELARMTERMVILQAEVQALRGTVGQQYTVDQARYDREAVSVRFSEIEARLRAVERAIDRRAPGG